MQARSACSRSTSFKIILNVDSENINQKIDAPPHLKRCGLIGARFLDAQDCIHPHTKVCDFLQEAILT